jgi:hypothetical protein
MSRNNHITTPILSLVLAIGVTSAFAANDKDKNKDENNQDNTGQVVSVPEPAILGLLVSGVAALGLSSLLRRRKH